MNTSREELGLETRELVFQEDIIKKKTILNLFKILNS